MTQTKTPIVQVEDYYPFGLTFNSYQRDSSLPDQYQYNGKELQDELNIGWLDYGARMYMPEVGRWGVVDPLSEKSRRWSVFVYVFNNPLRFIDPDGMAADDYTIHDDGSIEVVRDDKTTNNYKYVDSKGCETDLGTYDKADGGMVNIAKNGSGSGGSGWTMRLQNTATFIDQDAAAGFLGAAHSFNLETGRSLGITQFATEGGVHSSTNDHCGSIDIRYQNTDRTTNATSTSSANVDKGASQKAADKFLSFHFNSILTLAPDGSKEYLDNTTKYKNHDTHMHVQSFDKSKIKDKQVEPTKCE